MGFDGSGHGWLPVDAPQAASALTMYVGHWVSVKVQEPELTSRSVAPWTDWMVTMLRSASGRLLRFAFAAATHWVVQLKRVTVVQISISGVCGLGLHSSSVYAVQEETVWLKVVVARLWTPNWGSLHVG